MKAAAGMEAYAEAVVGACRQIRTELRSLRAAGWLMMGPTGDCESGILALLIHLLKDQIGNFDEVSREKAIADIVRELGRFEAEQEH